MQEKKEYTIYDIARMADVSATTVSRVLTNNPHVNKATRARVQKYIDQCHYVPNETARGLVTQSSKLIGILISDLRLTHHADGVFYVEQELAEHGYLCLILNTGVEEASMAKHIQLLSQRKVDAAVFMGSIYQTETVKQAITTYMSQTPVILCNGYLDLPNVYGVIADERFGVANCVELLIRKGKKHLAFLMDRATPSNLAKQQGFEFAVLHDLPGQSPLVVVSGNSTRFGALEATADLLKQHPETDGIIYADDVQASVGIRALQQMGKRIPEDVAVIGINNSFYAEMSTPALTSLDNMLYDQSMTAAKTILDILGGNRVNKRVVLCSEIVERETT